MRKSTLISFVILLVFTARLVSYAADIPKSLWADIDAFGAYYAAGNNEGIYSEGSKIIAVMEAQPESQTRTEMLAGKYYQVAQAAEALGLYDEAVRCYLKYIPYGEIMGETDGVIFARKKAKLLTARLNVFFKDSSFSRPVVYYGAKFEPEEGVLFGSVYDKDSRVNGYDKEKIKEFYRKVNSANLVYLEFGDDIEAHGRYDRFFREIKNSGATVMFAWNTALFLPDIEEYSGYIKNTIDYLGNTGVNIILRFSNEMNVAPNGDNPSEYIRAFRYVADMAHTKSNIAVCWAPNDIGALDRGFKEYYPGDEYVDWVGVSLYMNRFFKGVPNPDARQQDIDDTYFLCGDYADPTLRVSDIVEFMRAEGINKPFAISECGTPQKTNFTEDCLKWGAAHMGKLYGELVRNYPQIKLICYFNIERTDESQRYQLYDSPQLTEEYISAVSDDIFLDSAEKQIGFCYNPVIPDIISSETLEISASAYYPHTDYGMVTYFIDEIYAGGSGTAPYSCVLDLSGLSDGSHILKVNYAQDGKELLVKEYGFNYVKPINVILNGEKLVFTDVAPFIVDGRTLVPLRAIFEALGAEIEWNDETKTVTSKGGGVTVSFTIGSTELIRNGEVVVLDVPSQIYESRTVVPVRAIAESFGAKVSWVAETRTVDIISEI